MTEIISAEAVNNKQALYWRNRGVDASAHASLVQRLSVDLPRPGSTRDSVPLEISASATEQLRRISAGSDLAIYILFVTAFKAVAARMTGEPTVSVLSPVYLDPNRGSSARSDHVLLHDVVNPRGGLKENSAVTQRTVIGAYSNQDQFAERPSLVAEHAVVTFESLHDGESLVERSPLSIRLGWRGPRLVAEAVFDPGVVDRRLVAQCTRHLSTFLDRCTKEPSRPFGEIEVLSAAELEALDVFAHGPRRPIEDIGLHEMFGRRAAIAPSAIALIHRDRRLDYAELARMSDRLARSLVASGVVEGDYVVLMCTRSVEMVAAILAVGKAGAAFVPVSPETPGPRLEPILEATRARCVVTNLDTSHWHHNVPILTISVLLATDAGGALPQSVPATGVAYAILTSGSTGIPKAVVIEQRGIVNTVAWRSSAYGLSGGHRTLLALAYHFDGFIVNLFSAFAAGASVVLVTDADAKLPAALVTYVRDHAITQMALTPALFHAMLEESEASDLLSLVSVTLAGDVTRPSTLALAKSLRADLQLANEYGPTEASVVATFAETMDIETSAVIGTPIDNVILRILDEDLELVAPGVYGQLAIGGPGLAREYLNDPEETAVRFVHWRGERLYLTGDLGRWRSDGTIEFRGRTDGQIKLRGQRIELEDIRRQLLACSGLTDAVVFLDQDGPDASIVACFTAPEAVGSGAVMEQLRARVSHYMMPAQLIHLRELPLTEVGKYDFAALRARARAETVGGDEPATEVERQLATIWAKLLELDRVPVDKSFFSLGGHSLKATRLLTRIHAELGVTLSLEEIFRFNTIRQLAAIIQRDARPTSVIARVGDRATYPASSAQQRMLVLAADEGLRGSYTVPVAFRLSGWLDVSRLESALAVVIGRHASLRTSFAWEGDRPVQVVSAESRISVAKRSSTATDLAEALFGSPTHFDLSRGPLIAVTAIESCHGTHLLFELHHAIIDEPSLTVFFGELQQAFAGAELAPTPEIRYVDYAVWQREHKSSPRYEEKLAYWRTKLTGARLGPVEIPVEGIVAGSDLGRGKQHVLRLEEALSRSVHELCRDQELTLFMFFAAVFAIQLHRLAGAREVVLGAPVSERTLPELSGVVGLFLNTLPLHYRIDDAVSVRAFLRSAKTELLRDMAHVEVQLEDILSALAIKRSVDNRAAFNVMVAAVEDGFGTLALGEATARPVASHNGTAKFDLQLEVGGKSDDIRLVLEYATDRVGESTIEALGEHLLALVAEIAADPDVLLRDLSRVDPDERWNLDGEQLHSRTPEPAPTSSSTSSLEQDLIDVWANQLVIDRAAITSSESFFALGGDSLAIVSVAKTLRDWGYTVKLRDLFENDTIAKLCALLGQR